MSITMTDTNHESMTDAPQKIMRTIITIDEEKCDGCGLCVTACHEGAIGLVDGKARLLHEHYCDGLGDCLPACPTGAITFEKRLAAAYDEEAVLAAQQVAEEMKASLPCGCPGTAAKTFTPAPPVSACPGSAAKALVPEQPAAQPAIATEQPSQLRQWPVQIKLVPPNAPYFNGADVLIAADCAAFAYGSFHQDFMAGKITLIGCPKLDAIDYTEKLTAIFANNDIRSVTVARMEVPCCGGIEHAVVNAAAASGKDIPVQVVTITTDGRLR